MSGAVAQKAVIVSKEEMVGRLARHLEQQPEPVRASDRLMKGLEVASLALPLAGLVAAIVLVVTSGASLGKSIPAAVFGVWGCFALGVFLLGLHSAAIRAFPPVRYMIAAQNDKSPGFFTGDQAVGMGVFIMAAALIIAACCAMGAYAFFDPSILEILIPVIIVFSIGTGLGSTWLRRRSR